jgi:small-conductance mechanosensitive channel
MSGVRRVLIPGLVVGLVGLLAASWWTRGVMENLPFLRGGQGVEGVVDQRPWQTAVALAPLAVSREEQGLAREAERLADHEVDQAFAQALREATANPAPLTGEALAVQQKVAAIGDTVAQDQAEVDRLTALVNGPKGAAYKDELQVSQAELALDKSELADETEHLAQASGDKRAAIQRELAARQAAMKKFDDQIAAGGQAAVISTRKYQTLLGRVEAWFSQRSRKALLVQAQGQAKSDEAALDKVVAGLKAAKGGSIAVAEAPAVGGAAIDLKRARVAMLEKREARENILDLAEDRAATQGQLANVYGRWQTQLVLQHRIVEHMLLGSFAWVMVIVLATLLGRVAVSRLVDGAQVEARRAHTLRTIVDLGIELLGVMLVAFVVFGVPSQMPTVLGLTGAGLTVVFQDFILAFFGWFVLMGQNGIRVGDWVEINGVGGEVVEIGLFRTALLETGNWTDKGHPTGRRVTFINNFAITGQYFNFSTAGQWMWDEITLNVPPSEESGKLIEEIHQTVLKETQEDARKAEAEWRGAAKASGLSQFSAEPSVDLRPAASGVDIVVRYVTRAADRFGMRNRLYEDTLALLRKAGEKA